MRVFKCIELPLKLSNSEYRHFMLLGHHLDLLGLLDDSLVGLIEEKDKIIVAWSIIFIIIALLFFFKILFLINETLTTSDHQA